MTVKKDKVYTYIVFITLLTLGFIVGNSYVLVFLAITVYLCIGSMIESKSSIHMMFFLGYSSFIFLPAILNWYYLDVDFDLYFITSFVSSIFLNLTRLTVCKNFIDYGAQPKVIFVFSSIIMIMLSILNFGMIVAPSLAFIIFLLCFCFKQDSLKNNLIYFSIFCIVFLSYIIFSWGGYGRTVVVGWLILAFLQFCYSIGFKIDKYAFGLIPAFSSTLFSSRNIMELDFNGFENALYDSAYQPYRLASSFIEQYNTNGIDYSGFFDQILFTFFVFIPREIWITKPNGFGFEYTVRNFDESLVDAGHSIASTLIGDHIYFLGYLGIFSSIIILSIIAYVIRFFYNVRDLNGNGVIVFSSSMMVLVWGGMSSFSARIALPSIIFIFLILFFKRIFIGKLNFRFR